MASENKMNTQDVYNTVRDHLLAQGVRSTAGDATVQGFSFSDTCVYRGANDCKCAAGCLIDDAHYHPDLECKDTNNPQVWSALVASGVPDTKECRVLVFRLQAVHDSTQPEAWPEALCRVALTFDLLA